MTLLGGSIRVYRGGVLNQRGSGFLSGLLNVVKKGAKALAPSLLNAGKQIVMNSLPMAGEEFMKVVTGKQKAKQGFKNVFQRAIKPAAKTVVSNTAPTLLNAGKQIVMNSLPKAREEVMKVMTGKQKAKQGFKNVFQGAIKPAAETVVSNTLKSLVTGIKDRKPPPKRSKPSRPRSGNIKKRKKDIFDHGFNNDAA